MRKPKESSPRFALSGLAILVILGLATFRAAEFGLVAAKSRHGVTKTDDTINFNRFFHISTLLRLQRFDYSTNLRIDETFTVHRLRLNDFYAFHVFYVFYGFYDFYDFYDFYGFYGFYAFNDLTNSLIL
jgi:hypothetical protein